MRCGALRKLLKAFGACFSGYCKFSQLHGFRNIARADVRWYESLFWMGVCVSGIFMTFAMFSSVWHRYQLSPTITTIETNNFPIDNVPFPAVTFCNVNKVLKTSFEIMARKFEDLGVDESMLREYVSELFSIYLRENQTFTHEKLIKKVMKELGYNLESFAFDLAQPCSELLVQCFWSGKYYDCSSLFEEVKTQEGFCCSFNWRGEKLNFDRNNSIRKIWKKKSPLFGKDKRRLLVNSANSIFTGLSIIVDPDEENYLSTISSIAGCLVILHDAGEYPDLGSRISLIQARSQTALRLRASLTESSSDVRNLKISQRKCYFDGEFTIESGYKYSYGACLTECKMRSYLQKCGCIPYMYPNVTESLMCDLLGMKCILEKEGIQDFDASDEEWNFFETQYRCSCLPSCNDVRYDWTVEVNEIRSSKHLAPVFGNNLRSRSIISVYFEESLCVKFRLESLITWDSVIGSLSIPPAKFLSLDPKYSATDQYTQLPKKDDYFLLDNCEPMGIGGNSMGPCRMNTVGDRTSHQGSFKHCSPYFCITEVPQNYLAFADTPPSPGELVTIASFGGIFGLCLGGSIISLIELLYYVLYDYWKPCGEEMTLRTKRCKKSKAESKKLHRKILKGSLLREKQSVYDNRFLAWIK